MGQLPSASSTLGNIGTGANGGRRKKPEQPGTQPGQPSIQPSAPPGQPPTFAQMQQSGQARPAPQQFTPPPTQSGTAYNAGNVGNQLQQSISQALANPSRYDTSTFNTIRDSATNDLKAQFATQKDALETNLASRGLSASSFGANDLYSLTGQQDRALADLNSQLLQQAATTQAGDRSSAIASGQTYQNANQSNALQAAGLTGSLNGQDTLAKTAQNTQAQQFNVQQALNEKLGTGNLGVAQQQANTAQTATTGGLSLQQQQLAQQGTQFNVQQALADKLGTGGLNQSQQQIDLAKQQAAQSTALQTAGLTGVYTAPDDVNDPILHGGPNDPGTGYRASAPGVPATASGPSGVQTLAAQQAAAQQKLAEQGLGLQQQQLTQQGTQFGQNLGLEQQQLAQSGSQFNVQQALAEKLGTGNLGLQQQAQTNQATQFGQTLEQQKAQQAQQNLLAQSALTGQSPQDITDPILHGGPNDPGTGYRASAPGVPATAGPTTTAEQSLDLQRQQQATQATQGNQNLLLQLLNQLGGTQQTGLAAQIAQLLGVSIPGGADAQQGYVIDKITGQVRPRQANDPVTEGGT